MKRLDTTPTYKSDVGPNWVIDITAACRQRGIENAYQLWQKIGGSKATTAQLFSGRSEMIRIETMNRLHSILGISPFEYIINKRA
jgi:hypothetical protein